MPNSDKGFSQACNAQICAESENMIIAETHVTQDPSDKNELVPALDNLENLSESLGKPSKMAADAGYFSQDNIEACEEKTIDPYIPPGRIHHHPALTEQLAPAPAPEEVLPGASPSEKMRYKLKTEAGKAVYKLRKQAAESVFGVMKSVMGFRRFSQRGLDKTSPEWQFASTCYNLKKIHKLQPTFSVSLNKQI
ncbi:MAG: transposase [Deltaproteobacteria bacterium]|jgi:IS5 family transposase|nr:transposase [Deltaproteobacteria bacterium]